MSAKSLKGVFKILDYYAKYGSHKGDEEWVWFLNGPIYHLYRFNWGKMFFPIQRALTRALRHASNNNHMNVIKILLSLSDNIDINKRDEVGDTLLMMAVKKSNVRIVEDLLYKGAKPNIRNNFKYSPLMMAAYNENIEIVKLLMRSGADVSFRSYDGTSAEEFANWRGNHDVAKMVRV